MSELRDGKLTPEDQPRQISPALLRLLLHLDNPLAWSSVMLRADALRSLDPPLRPQFEPADDFDLYHRLLGRGHIARLDPELTTYRWHASNATYATGANIADGATRVLTRAYTPWFGADAPAAASLVVRHGHERNAVADATTMARLRDVTCRVASGLAASHPAEASEITAGSRRLLWRFTRAAVRSGRPTLFRLPAPPLDAATSLVVGTGRFCFQITRRS